MEVAGGHESGAAFSLRERLLAHHSRDEVPPCVGVESDGYFGGDAPVTGRSIRVNVHEGMDLLVHDIRVRKDAEQEVASEPCLALTLLLDGQGEGAVTDPITGVELVRPIAYRPGTLYVSFSTRPLGGRSRAGAGSRYRLMEMRLSPGFLLRLGVEPMLLQLGREHGLHRASGSGFWIGKAPAPARLLILAEQIHEGVLGGGTGDLALDARTLDVLRVCLDLLSGGHGTAAAAILPGRSRRRIMEAARLLAAHPARQWTIAKLASAVGLGEKALKQGFRACLDTTVIGHLRDVRLDAGRQLIENSTDSITEISLRVGYANPSHFARLYRQCYGETPTATRARM